QNTFCIPGFELFVGGRSGQGAVEDNIRLCEFIYRNLGKLTHIIATMDTHTSQQIFHPIFFVDAGENHPAPYTDIHADELQAGKWTFNPELAPQFEIAPEYGQQMMIHYAEALQKKGKYALTIWPYHAMLGGIGHALVPAVEEAIFFHSAVRYSQPDFQIKGRNPLTEHYSVFGPEITTDADGKRIAEKNSELINKLKSYDRIIIAGQAKSHCVAWSVDDLLNEAPETADKVYLLEDATSPVVIPGVIDFTDQANESFK